MAGPRGEIGGLAQRRAAVESNTARDTVSTRAQVTVENGAVEREPRRESAARSPVQVCQRAFVRHHPSIHPPTHLPIYHPSMSPPIHLFTHSLTHPIIDTYRGISRTTLSLFNLFSETHSSTDIFYSTSMTFHSDTNETE